MKRFGPIVFKTLFGSSNIQSCGNVDWYLNFGSNLLP